MEIPDKIVENVLTSISEVLLEKKKLKGKDKKLAKSYNKLLTVADKEYNHDFPFFDLSSDGG